MRPFRAMSMSAAGRGICIAIDEAINWIAGPDFQEESERPLFINMYDNPLPVTFIIPKTGTQQPNHITAIGQNFRSLPGSLGPKRAIILVRCKDRQAQIH